jgi:hypothetical protein
MYTYFRCLSRQKIPHRISSIVHRAAFHCTSWLHLMSPRLLGYNTHPGYFCDTARFLPGISGFLSPMSLLTGLFLRDRSIFALESPGFSNQRPKTHKPPLPHCNQFFLSVTTYPHSRTQDGATIKAKPGISCLLCQSIPKKLISQLVQSTLTATALPTIYDHDPGSLFRVLSQQPKHTKKTICIWVTWKTLLGESSIQLSNLHLSQLLNQHPYALLNPPLNQCPTLQKTPEFCFFTKL